MERTRFDQRMRDLGLTRAPTRLPKATRGYYR
jgi:hypothetical protein